MPIPVQSAFRATLPPEFVFGCREPMFDLPAALFSALLRQAAAVVAHHHPKCGVQEHDDPERRNQEPAHTSAHTPHDDSEMSVIL